MQSLGFQRILSAAERAPYEAAMQRSFPGFRIERWNDGIRSPVPSQQWYRVIDYIEPLERNRGAFGLDTSRTVVLSEASARAADSGLPAATNLLALPQGPSNPNGMVIFLPIYQRDAALSNSAQRRAALIGFTTVAFRADELIQQTLVAGHMLDQDDSSVSVYTGDFPTEADLIYRVGPRRPANDWSATVHQCAVRFNGSKEISQDISIGGRGWKIVVSTPSANLPADHLGSLSVLLGGILATILAGLNVHMFVARARRVENLVTLRTTQLEESNAELQSELSTRGRIEQALLLRERAIECSANAMTISSAQAPDYPILYVNPAFERTTGYRADEVIGKSCRLLQGEDIEQVGLNEIRAALREQRAGRAVVRNYRKDGSLFWNDLFVSPVRDAQGVVTHFVASQYDVSETKRYEFELETQASRDMLTGLANRYLLKDRLKKAISQASRYGQSIWVLVFDLDRFKLINDSLGQAAGDIVLKAVANRLKSSAREIDTVARLGADEFVLVLPQHADRGMSTDVVQRVMNAVSEYITVDQQDLHVSSSVGIAVYPTDGTDPDTLLTHAGDAMYRAKEAGRNNFQFYRAEMTARANDRLRIEAELHNALARSEFELHYQPQVDLRSGRIVGMEALIRWSHPTLGMIAPLDLIGIAEDAGLIIPIGAWVIRTAVQQNIRWAQSGLGDLRVAVNLSARQFAQADLVEMIAATLGEAGMAPHLLEIELTESLIMTDVQHAILTLQQLKRVGVQVSVDDFGTGYSSLAYLKRFPIDTLKIDRAFVRDISTDADDAGIVAAIIALAHTLRLTVIAEGVETDAQLIYLRSQGCDEMQGYLFSRLLRADAFELLLRKSIAQDAVTLH